MQKLLQEYKNLWDKEHLVSLISTVIIVVIAVIAQKLADSYVGSLHTAYVGDLILDHIPALGIDDFIVLVSLLLTFITVLVVAMRPKFILFAIKTIAIFIIIRAFFISLTHLGVSPKHITFDSNDFGYTIYNYLYNTQGDFFFSGHTGLPALMSFVFWNQKKIRVFFIISSIIMGISVLLAHMHYSIDVFAAPFMAYGIFTLSLTLFRKEYKLTNS